MSKIMACSNKKPKQQTTGEKCYLNKTNENAHDHSSQYQFTQNQVPVNQCHNKKHNTTNKNVISCSEKSNKSNQYTNSEAVGALFSGNKQQQETNSQSTQQKSVKNLTKLKMYKQKVDKRNPQVGIHWGGNELDESCVNKLSTTEVNRKQIISVVEYVREYEEKEPMKNVDVNNIKSELVFSEGIGEFGRKVTEPLKSELVFSECIGEFGRKVTEPLKSEVAYNVKSELLDEFSEQEKVAELLKSEVAYNVKSELLDEFSEQEKVAELLKSIDADNIKREREKVTEPLKSIDADNIKREREKVTEPLKSIDTDNIKRELLDKFGRQEKVAGPLKCVSNKNNEANVLESKSAHKIIESSKKVKGLNSTDHEKCVSKYGVVLNIAEIHKQNKAIKGGRTSNNRYFSTEETMSQIKTPLYPKRFHLSPRLNPKGYNLEPIEIICLDSSPSYGKSSIVEMNVPSLPRPPMVSVDSSNKSSIEINCTHPWKSNSDVSNKPDQSENISVLHSSPKSTVGKETKGVSVNEKKRKMEETVSLKWKKQRRVEGFEIPIRAVPSLVFPYHPSCWTYDKVQFYDNSRKGKQYNHVTLQKNMSGNPNKWRILDVNRFSPFFITGLNVKSHCHNYQQPGHIFWYCPECLKVPCCNLCGRQGHRESRCPNTMCLQCGRSSYEYAFGCVRCN